MDKLELHPDQIWILDRFYASIKPPVDWPLEGESPGEPMGAVLAWVRAGAQDPRCLWWVVERYGTAELIDALNDLRYAEGILIEPARQWALHWLQLVATEAFGFTEIAPDGSRFFEA